MNKYINLLLNSEINSMSKVYKSQFMEERLSINLTRNIIYALILIIWNVQMAIYIGIMKNNGSWERVPAYKYEFYHHIAGFLFAAIFLLLFTKVKKQVNTRINNIKYLLNFWFLGFILYWTTIMTVIDLSVNQQMVVYTMGILGVSISLIMSPKENSLIYFSSYILLVVGTLLTQHNYALIESSIFNGLIVAVLGFVISKMIFGLHVKDFLKSRTIEEKTIELENSHKRLEKALLERTEELAAANEQLVQEINTRHAIEIQALKTDLENKKNIIALNEAVEYDKVMGEFFANISHELRTPLNIIFCSLKMINNQIFMNSEEIDKKYISKYTMLMKQNCYRLLRLINNLIDITKIDSGYLRINLSNLDIVKIVEKITMSVVSYAEYKGLSVIFDTDMEEKVIACDPDEIERIILNLLSNAIKFTDPGGMITVNMHEINDCVVIKVKDTGIGIPKDKQKAIFERFIQVDKSTTREKEGSGIGLSLIKSFVEMHNGTISVESAPGDGSEFIIELPDIKCDNNSIDYKNNRIMENTEVINIEFSDIYSIDKGEHPILGIKN